MALPSSFTSLLSYGQLGVPGRNLLLNPGFELKGNGWMTMYFFPRTVEAATTIAACPPCGVAPGQGPDGSTAFLLSAGPSLISYCTPLELGATYTLSAYVKAVDKPGKLWMACLDPGFRMYTYTESDIPADRWTRYSLTFQWDKGSKQRRMYARFNSSGGSLLLDNVQLEKGKLTDYEAPPVTVGLVAADGADSVMVRGQGQARMLLRAIPSPAARQGAHVQMTVLDPWGKEAWNKSLDIDGQKPVEMPIDIPTDRMGVFHAVLKATAPDGTVLGLGKARFAVVDLPIIEPRRDDAMPLFGWCEESERLPAWSMERMSRWGKLLGVRTNRFFLHVPPYDSVEPPAEYVAALRSQCESQRKADVDLMPTVGLFPESLRNQLLDAEMPTTEMLTEYRNRLAALVKAMAGDIRYWEIMNEPNLWRYGSGPKRGQMSMQPPKYVAILKAAREAIHGVDPKLRVVAPALNGTGLVYLQGMLDQGAVNMMDVFSLHPYRASPDMPSTYEDLQKVIQTLRGAGFKGPVVSGEQYYGANLFDLSGNDEENGRDYYELQGRPVTPPARPFERPAPELLRWHNDTIFRG